MTIRLLRTLVAVADAKTFSAAADVVHVTHAAVSQQMRSLEADLGLELFNRTTRTPELTPVALQVVEKARKLIEDYDNLVPSVLSDGGLTGAFTLGAVPTTLTGLAPQGLAALKKKFPKIGLHIRPGLSQNLLAELERGALDAAIVVKPHLMPVGLEFRELSCEKLQLIAAQQEPINDTVTLLQERPFIRFSRSAVVGTLIDNWILSRRLRVRESMELDSLEAITSMVHENLGVSIVPRLAVPPPRGLTVKCLDLGEDAPRRSVGLAYRKDHIKTRATTEVFEALAGVIARIGRRT